MAIVYPLLYTKARNIIDKKKKKKKKKIQGDVVGQLLAGMEKVAGDLAF